MYTRFIPPFLISLSLSLSFVLLPLMSVSVFLMVQWLMLPLTRFIITEPLNLKTILLVSADLSILPSHLSLLEQENIRRRKKNEFMRRKSRTTE